MRSRYLTVSLMLTGLVALQACGDPEVEIVALDDLPSTIPEGQTFERRFEAKPPLDGGAFIECIGSQDPKLKVSRDGILTYPANTEGLEVDLCVAYRNGDGGHVAKHEFKLTVGPRARATDDDFQAPVATHRKQLRALVNAVRTGKVAPGSVDACAELAVPVAQPLPYTIYDSGWVDAALDPAAPDLQGPVLLGPARKMRANLTETESRLDTESTRDLGRAYAVVVVPETLVMPNLIVPEQFAAFQAPSFEAGSFEGTLHIGKLASGEIVCSMPLSFSSSESVSWTDWFREGEARESTAGRLRLKLLEDFARNGGTAVRDAIAQPSG